MARFFTPSRLSENIRETPEGYLLCMNVPIARTGWQEYGPGETPLEVGEEGVVWVYRDAKEVFKPQTIASYNGKSVTIKHPQDFVDPKNWKMLTHGIAQNARRGEEKDKDGEEQMLADLLITDDFAIGLVQNGLREVSCGYDAEYESTGDGEGRQFNIIGNHIALVEQGRAGSAYSIKDHKRKADDIMTLKELAEKISNLGKTVDEEVKKQETKPKPSKTKDDGDMGYDELVKAVHDLGEKVEGMKKAGDEEKPKEKEKEKKEPVAEDSDEDEEVGQNSRLDKLEAAVAKILKALGNKGAEDEEEEESEDEDMCDADEESEEDMSGDEDELEESKDADEEEKPKKTGDASHIEILTPGQKFSGKDARTKCLKAFAKTKDGMEVLKTLGMSKPVFDAKTNVDMIFMAASAIMKGKRGVGLKGTKDGSKWTDENLENTSGAALTAEELNEINAKHYGTAK